MPHSSCTRDRERLHACDREHAREYYIMRVHTYVPRVVAGGGVIDYCCMRSRARVIGPGVKLQDKEDKYEEGSKTTGDTTAKNT